MLETTYDLNAYCFPPYLLQPVFLQAMVDVAARGADEEAVIVPFDLSGFAKKIEPL